MTPGTSELPYPAEIPQLPELTVMPALTMVTYKASITRSDGGWDHCEITTQSPATPEDVAAAVATWQALREAAFPLLQAGGGQVAQTPIPGRPVVQLPPIEENALDSKVGFGKYASESLAWVKDNDPDYFDWLTTKWMPRGGPESDRFRTILERLFDQANRANVRAVEPQPAVRTQPKAPKVSDPDDLPF